MAKNDRLKKIVIMGAMPQEIEEYQRQCAGGIWHGKQITVGLSGVGKSACAASTARLITLYKPDYMIFTGAAGALSPEIKMGEIGIGLAAIDVDMDVRAWKPQYTLGRRPFYEDRVYKSDMNLSDKCESFISREARVFKAYIATGDTFLDADGKNNFNKVKAPLLEDIVDGSMKRPNLYDMESAAFLQTAQTYDVPALVIRVVSDTLGGDVAEDFEKFMVRTVKEYVPLVEHVVKNI